MKNQDYWRQRFEQLENAQNQMGLDALAEITQQYNKAIRNIDKQIRDWYSRFADNNGFINMAEARKFLKGKELKEFKWDLKEYADKARQSAFSDTWEKELLNISAKVHVSRLEALKTQLRQQVEMLFAEQADVMQKSLGESYKSDYYHSAYEIQKGFNVGWDMPSIDQNAINTVLSKPWAPDGYNFSERIWNNKEKLLSELNTVMTQNIMTGAGPQKAIDTLAKKMNTSRSNAGRLVMTESAYFSSLGRQQCFKDLGVEKYEYVATLDRKTSETCRDLDGKVFDIDDYKPGTNAPPMHCWCRSCIVPYFGDDEGISGERAARDPKTGKTIRVPGEMTYKEWEKEFAEQVRATTPDPATTQNYAPVKLNNEQAVKTHRGDREITLHRVLTAANPIYVSESVTLKPKALRNIDGAITQVLDILKVQRDDMPKVYVVSHADMQKPALAAYLALDNVIFLDIALGNKRKALSMQSSYAASDNYLSTLLHEYYHWLEARKYIDSGKPIRNNEDYVKYIAEMNRKAKKAIERLEKQGYNVGRVSEYAQSSLEDKDYDEAYTEFKVYEDLR